MTPCEQNQSFPESGALMRGHRNKQFSSYNVNEIFLDYSLVV